MRNQKAGFAFGTQWINIGFLMKVHPNYDDLNSINQVLQSSFKHGWTNDSNYWTTTEKTKILNAIATVKKGAKFNFESDDLPIVIQANAFKDKSTDGTKVASAYAACVMTPIKLQTAAKEIMDYLLLQDGVMPRYIPTAYKAEDPTDYFALIEQHAYWMSQHRNIQILNVPDSDHFSTIKGTVVTESLRQLLENNIASSNIRFNQEKQRVDVSVNVDQYIPTIEQLTMEIARYQFPFDINIKRPVVRSVASSKGPSIKSKTSTDNVSATASQQPPKMSYADILSHHKYGRNTPTDFSSTTSRKKVGSRRSSSKKTPIPTD